MYPTILIIIKNKQGIRDAWGANYPYQTLQFAPI